MNKEAILALACRVEATEHARIEVNDPFDADSVGHFNMHEYVFNCGAPACIAGHAAQMSGTNLGGAKYIGDGIFESARAALGLHPDTASKLFLPQASDCVIPRRFITPTQAAATLRRLADTGEVVWATPDCAFTGCEYKGITYCNYGQHAICAGHIARPGSRRCDACKQADGEIAGAARAKAQA